MDQVQLIHILKNIAQKQHGIAHLQKGIQCDLDRMFAILQEESIIPINQIFGEEKNVD